MRNRISGIGIALLLACSSLSYAQQEIVGTYAGSYSVSSGHPERYSATLTITGVVNGKVAGKFHIDASTCGGDYPIDGAYQDGKLDLRTGEGSMRGCGQDAVKLVLQGNRLVGTIGGFNASLGKK